MKLSTSSASSGPAHSCCCSSCAIICGAVNKRKSGGDIGVWGGGGGFVFNYIHLYMKFKHPRFVTHGMGTQTGPGPYIPGMPVHIFREKAVCGSDRQWRDTDTAASYSALSAAEAGCNVALRRRLPIPFYIITISIQGGEALLLRCRAVRREDGKVVWKSMDEEDG